MVVQALWGACSLPRTRTPITCNSTSKVLSEKRAAPSLHSQGRHYRQPLSCSANGTGELLDQLKLTADLQMLLENPRKEDLNP